MHNLLLSLLSLNFPNETKLGKNLKETINNSLEMNEVLVWNRWIDCFHENNVIENDNVLIKRKPPFNIICDTLQNNFQDIKTLIDLLK